VANFNLSPNMSLPVPSVGVDPGPDYALNLNSSLLILDQHNHSPGSGVPITPSGLNINADLAFDSNNATFLRSARFVPQLTTLSLPTDIGCVYVSGVDLWYNDVNGNKIKITAGGTVNATSSGITSGTASASFSSGVLVVNAASNTPANIQVGSVLLGNNTAGSKFLTLSPPNAMPSNFTLVLPNIPSVTSIMALDTSGNISAPYTVDNSTIVISSNVIEVPAGGITTTQIAAGTIVASNIAPQSISQGLLVPKSGNNPASAGEIAISAVVSPAVGTSSNSYVDLIGPVTLTTTGGPVMVMLEGCDIGATSNGYVQVSQASAAGFLTFINGTNSQYCGSVELTTPAGATGGMQFNPSLFGIDFSTVGTPGTYSYYLQVRTNSFVTIDLVRLLAYEL
jgi:hypothetical protein